LSVHKYFFDAQVSFFGQQQNYGRENIFQVTLQPFAPETVDRVVVWLVHPAKPHEVNVFLQRVFHLPTGIDVAQVGIDKHFEQHAGIIP
jgi:hypothetical protein